MSTDSIADYLTRIRNAVMAKKVIVEIPSSNLKKEITRILFEQKYIESYEVADDNKQGILKIKLKYTPNGTCAISGLKRISKPGLRIYQNASSVERVLNGLGIAILSTSNGLKTDKQARAENIGGEVICHVW